MDWVIQATEASTPILKAQDTCSQMTEAIRKQSQTKRRNKDNRGQQTSTISKIDRELEITLTSSLRISTCKPRNKADSSRIRLILHWIKRSTSRLSQTEDKRDIPQIRCWVHLRAKMRLKHWEKSLVHHTYLTQAAASNRALFVTKWSRVNLTPAQAMTNESNACLCES